jgi:hypothetical protein
MGQLSADGTTVLRNDDLRVRSTAQESTRTIHIDVKTPAGYTRVAIDVDSGDVVASTKGRTSTAAYESMLAALKDRRRSS